MASQEEITRVNVEISRRLFWVGCALLPWVWIMNLFYFRHALLDPSAPAELRLCALRHSATRALWDGRGGGRGERGGDTRAMLRGRCAGLSRSLWGAVVFTVLFIVWIIVFQTQHQHWGQTGQNLLIYQPPVWFLQS
jgi:hypothetical protein